MEAVEGGDVAALCQVIQIACETKVKGPGLVRDLAAVVPEDPIPDETTALNLAQDFTVAGDDQGGGIAFTGVLIVGQGPVEGPAFEAVRAGYVGRLDRAVIGGLRGAGKQDAGEDQRGNEYGSHFHDGFGRIRF